MSAKALDKYGRWRSVSVSFRASPSEVEQIHFAVQLSGLTKQEFVIRTLLNQQIHVSANPRVYKALVCRMMQILDELHRINAGERIDGDLLDTIRMITCLLGDVKEVNV